MRLVVLTTLCASALWSQTLGEYAGAAAGGAVGGASGKKVSDGLTRVFEIVDKQSTAAAASPTPKAPVTAPAPLIQAGTGVPTFSGGAVPSGGSASSNGFAPSRRAAVKPADSVPPPPPLSSSPVFAPPAAFAPVAPAPVAAPPPAPPPPVTAEDLNKVVVGWSRDEVLKLGLPSSRITMFDDGHLQETFRYMTADATFGVVRLSDGAVSAIEMRR